MGGSGGNSDTGIWRRSKRAPRNGESILLESVLDESERDGKSLEDGKSGVRVEVEVTRTQGQRGMRE
jgi:hypothetical protein